MYIHPDQVGSRSLPLAVFIFRRIFRTCFVTFSLNIWILIPVRKTLDVSRCCNVVKYFVQTCRRPRHHGRTKDPPPPTLSSSLGCLQRLLTPLQNLHRYGIVHIFDRVQNMLECDNSMCFMLFGIKFKLEWKRLQ